MALTLPRRQTLLHRASNYCEVLKVWCSMAARPLTKHLEGALIPHATAQGLTGAGRRQGWATASAHALRPPTAASSAQPGTTNGRPCSRRAQSSL